METNGTYRWSPQGADEVVAALEQAGLQVTDRKEMEDWRCVSARRRTV